MLQILAVIFAITLWSGAFWASTAGPRSPSATLQPRRIGQRGAEIHAVPTLHGCIHFLQSTELF